MRSPKKSARLTKTCSLATDTSSLCRTTGLTETRETRLLPGRFGDIVNRLLSRRPEFHTREAAAAAGISRQAAHRRLATLVGKGELVREGEGRGARYRRGGRSGATLAYSRKGLEEDRVWTEAQERVPFLRGLPDNAVRILRYALTEMVNNAIDHSRSVRIQVEFPPSPPDLCFEVRVVVKLFGFGVRFVSRSEAKRLLSGLHRFRDVVLDFKGVEEIGQGFADEVFRVWARAHPKVRLKPVHMVETVEFMVRRAMK